MSMYTLHCKNTAGYMYTTIVGGFDESHAPPHALVKFYVQSMWKHIPVSYDMYDCDCDL